MRTRLLPKYASATCPNCDTVFSDLPVEGDQDGAYVEIETVPCHDEECTKRLCSCCDQFMCDACGLTFCMDHLGIEEEEECTCRQTDVDQFDAGDCRLHDGRRHEPRRFCRECSKTDDAESVPQCPEATVIWEQGNTIAEIEAGLARHGAVCQRCAALTPTPPCSETGRLVAKVVGKVCE